MWMRHERRVPLCVCGTISTRDRLVGLQFTGIRLKR